MNARFVCAACGKRGDGCPTGLQLEWTNRPGDDGIPEYDVNEKTAPARFKDVLGLGSSGSAGGEVETGALDQHPALPLVPKARSAAPFRQEMTAYLAGMRSTFEFCLPTRANMTATASA